MMVPIYHDSSDSEPASGHTVDNVTIVTVDQSGSTPSTSERVTTGRTVVESDGATTITTAALPALDLPPPEEQEQVEDMAAKGQKRLRDRGDSDSGDEVQHKSVWDISGDRMSTTPASPSADLPDTTVAVHLDPDTVPSEVSASSVVVVGTTSVPPEAVAATGDASTDTTSVPPAAGTAVITSDGSAISGSPSMVERFATIAECISSDESDHPPAPSSARPEAMVSLATDAVSQNAANTTLVSTVSASSSSDESANSVEPNQVPTTNGVPLPLSYTGPNLLAQLHRALLRWAESNPAIEVRPLSPAVDDSTEAESVDSILDDSAGNSPASLIVDSSDPEEWYTPGHDVWPDSGCSTPPVSSGSDDGEKTPSPATTPAASVGGDSLSSSVVEAAFSSEDDIPPGDTGTAERESCWAGAEKPSPESSQ